ncbi:uncharacterized protein G2W53_016549 [Senna tora]|uniref:Uncharacterized protein n=1 Tax=Senna tora TaxID=362788 RepID=A0A834TRU2_9FABA|nr:uncharacterized protein G2W53_016549 [Senna tora]
MEICNLIAAVVPPSSVIQGDHIAWKYNKEGMDLAFCATTPQNPDLSAPCISTEEEDLNDFTIDKGIWKRLIRLEQERTLDLM